MDRDRKAAGDGVAAPGRLNRPRILLVDDHALVRAGLRQLIGSAMEAHITEAEDVSQANLALDRWRPDVVVLDIGLPDLGGLALMPRLAASEIPVLMLSMHAGPAYVDRALADGATGFASKNLAPAELLRALGEVMAGRRYLEPALAQALDLHRGRSGDRLGRLSAREMDILRLLAAGRSMTEIGRAAGVSYKTIANTAGIIRAKLGVARNTELIRLAIEMQGQNG